jgi:hypothetical protein
MDLIISEDPADEKTFDGGFGALAKWHREQAGQCGAVRRSNTHRAVRVAHPLGFQFGFR